MAQHYLVYQAYGLPGIIAEARYSLLSFLRVAGSWSQQHITVLVYTDQPTAFAFLAQTGVAHEVQLLTPHQLQAWRGPLDFVHRVKVEMLLDVVVKHTGSVLYVDTDTVFLEDPEPLFHLIESGLRIFHAEEEKISTRRDKTYRRINHALQQPDSLIPRSGAVWNAGVIGFSTADRPWLNEVLQLTDWLHEQVPKHVSEQLAFSYVLPREFPIVAANDRIFHYWNFKEFRAVLTDFFARFGMLSVAEQMRQSEHILPQRLIEPKLAYEKLSFWPKALRKLRKQRWVLPAIRYED